MKMINLIKKRVRSNLFIRMSYAVCVYSAIIPMLCAVSKSFFYKRLWRQYLSVIELRQTAFQLFTDTNK